MVVWQAQVGMLSVVPTVPHREGAPGGMGALVAPGAGFGELSRAGEGAKVVGAFEARVRVRPRAYLRRLYRHASVAENLLSILDSRVVMKTVAFGEVLENPPNRRAKRFTQEPVGESWPAFRLAT